jgi:hypothetical protein
VHVKCKSGIDTFNRIPVSQFDALLCQTAIECMQVYVKIDKNKPIVDAPSSFQATKGIASRLFHGHRRIMPLYRSTFAHTPDRQIEGIRSRIAKHSQKE